MSLEGNPSKWIIFCFSSNGRILASAIETVVREHLKIEVCIFEKANNQNIKQFLSANFTQGNMILFIGAVGIAVRSIAPYVKDKLTDPAVIVIDDMGEHVIPILSGHIGGANRISQQLADLLRESGYLAQPIVTTATDRRGIKGIEEIFEKYAVPFAPNRLLMKRMNMHLVEGGEVLVYIDPYLGKDKKITLKQENGSDDNHIGQVDAKEKGFKKIILLIALRAPSRWYTPEDSSDMESETIVIESHSLILGTGSRKGLDDEIYRHSLVESLETEGFLPGCICMLASIALKKDERCMLKLSETLGIEFKCYDTDLLMPYESLFTASQFVKRQVGIGSVAGVCAYYLTKDELTFNVYKKNGCTFSIGRLIR